MRKARLWTTFAVLCLTALGSSSSAAEEGKVSAMSPWEATGEVFQVSPGQLQFLGKFEGIFFLERGEGRLDAALMLCPGTQMLDLQTGETLGSGHCILTGAQGNQVFAEWSCSGKTGQGCTGEMRLTGGTGPFEGITGSGEMLLRTVLSQLAADLRSGEVVSHAAGLAVWPSLNYRIPKP